jgi:hypothetical protein
VTRPSPTLAWRAALSAAAAWCLVLAGCNSGTSNCPTPQSVTPAGACADNDQQCPFNLDTPSPACDGTTTTIASSCTCTAGTWACPAPVQCGSDSGSPDASADTSMDTSIPDAAGDAKQDGPG